MLCHAVLCFIMASCISRSLVMLSKAAVLYDDLVWRIFYALLCFCFLLFTVGLRSDLFLCWPCYISSYTLVLNYALFCYVALGMLDDGL